MSPKEIADKFQAFVDYAKAEEEPVIVVKADWLDTLLADYRRQSELLEEARKVLEVADAWKWSFDEGLSWHFGANKPGKFRFGDPGLVVPLYARADSASMKAAYAEGWEASKTVSPATSWKDGWNFSNALRGLKNGE